MTWKERFLAWVFNDRDSELDSPYPHNYSYDATPWRGFDPELTEDTPRSGMIDYPDYGPPCSGELPDDPSDPMFPFIKSGKYSFRELCLIKQQQDREMNKND
jgi:hypothetical protein